MEAERAGAGLRDRTRMFRPRTGVSYRGTFLEMSVTNGAKRRKVPNYRHGVLCLEGDWWGAKDPTTVEPGLELLRKIAGVSLRYEHRDVSTFEELRFHVDRWTNRQFDSHPILYLGFHGDTGGIWVGAPRKQRLVKFSDLEEMIGERGRGRVVWFGSCGTLRAHGASLDAFMRRTGIEAVCGYEGDIDWLEGIAFEMLALAQMQRHRLDRRGLTATAGDIRRQYAGFMKKVGFRIRIAKPLSRR